MSSSSLVPNKCSSEVAEFVEEHGGQQTFTNVLAATKDLLVGKEAQEFVRKIALSRFRIFS